MQSEFGAEVGDRASGVIGVGSVEPRIATRERLIEVRHDAIVGFEELRILGASHQARRIHQLQEQDRVVTGTLPKEFVDAAKDLTRLAAPTPPEVGGDVRQTANAIRKMGDTRLSLGHWVRKASRSSAQ